MGIKNHPTLICNEDAKDTLTFRVHSDSVVFEYERTGDQFHTVYVSPGEAEIFANAILSEVARARRGG